jgi:hypothetical protein
VELQDVWNVMYFYQRLWLAVRHGHVHKRYVPGLFGDVFYWWWEHSFQRQLVPLPTEPAQHVQALQHWLEAHSTQDDRTRWRISNEAFSGRVRGNPPDGSSEATVD